MLEISKESVVLCKNVSSRGKLQVVWRVEVASVVVFGVERHGAGGNAKLMLQG